MHSHIDIKVNGQSMVLPEDFSLPVTEENPLFHDVEMHSDPVQVPIDGNRSVFQNVDDPKSDLRPISMEHKDAQITVDGVPFRSGTVVIQEDEELDGNFSFNIDEATQSFRDLIGDLKCQDIPLYNDEKIKVGEKLSDVNITVNYDFYAHVDPVGGYIDIMKKNLTASGSFTPQALGFSCPGELSGAGVKWKSYPEVGDVASPLFSKSFINVTDPYTSNGGVPSEGGWRYCNARVCYTHYGLDTAKAVEDVYEVNEQNPNLKRLVKKGTPGETTSDIEKVPDNFPLNENYGPYWVLDANRQQSGLCFYVLYFLDCLFHHLGVTFDNSELLEIEDFRRLCFFTTHHKYVADDKNPVSTLNDITNINMWLETRGCGGRIEVNDTERESVDELRVSVSTNEGGSYYCEIGGTKIKLVNGTEDCYFKVGEEFEYATTPGSTKKAKIETIRTWATINSFSATAKVVPMYATSENFPDESVSTIISSLENSFGIRFYYDYQRKKVTAYLLREVFRSTEAPIVLPATILKVNKLSEKITGVRMKYSAESDGREQMENIRRAKRDYDTDFDYVDYRDERTTVGDNYMQIVNDKRIENLTCYVDLSTANAYRWKISKDVDSASIAYHRLFEVGQFKGIEVGDCSKQNENFVKELISDFQPVSFNDVNAYAEQKLGSRQSILAAYVDEDMEHEFVTQKINHAIADDGTTVYATEVLQLIESYDPTSTDDGESPLQAYDWGLAVAIMRGGGTDADIINFDRGYDGFDNSKWKTVAGAYAMASDTMDQFGNEFDYNGTSSGDGGGERFSLKIRSYKPFLYYTEGDNIHITSDMSLLGKTVVGDENSDSQSSDDDAVWQLPVIAEKSVKMRGLADTFMAEYIRFLLNRKKYRIHCLMETATLVTIPNHWRSRFLIGDNLGYIDKINYSIDAQNGIGEVTIDFYAL